MNDKQLLTEWMKFEYTPALVKESRDSNNGKILMKGILQKADTVNQNGRIYPSIILDREVRNYQKFIKENRALGECVDEETQIHTKLGWKYVSDINVGDIVFTLNLENDEIEEQPVLAKIDKPSSGKMIHFTNGKTLDMMLTPDHKVLIWDRKNKPNYLPAQNVADLLEEGSSYISHAGLKFNGKWSGKDNNSDFFLPDYDVKINKKSWAAFMGIYLSEGCADGTKRGFSLTNGVQITQTKEKEIIEIEEMLKSLPFDFKKRPRKYGGVDFVISDKHLHDHLYPLGHSFTKYIPEYVKYWDQEHLEIFMTWMLKGDGRNRRGRKNELVREYCTVSPKLASDMEEIFLKLGFGSRTFTYVQPDRQMGDRWILSENSKPMNIVSEHRAKTIGLDIRFTQAKYVDYEKNVYCVTTENGNWLARRHGKAFWTGNCDHPDTSVVELKNASHIVKEAYMDGKVCYGLVELLDTPSGKILQSLVESGVTLGISSRGVGSTKKEGEYDVVQDDFQLICWDFVSEPSTPNAFMMKEGINLDHRGKNKNLNKSDKIDRIFNDIINWSK